MFLQKQLTASSSILYVSVGSNEPLLITLWLTNTTIKIIQIITRRCLLLCDDTIRVIQHIKQKTETEKSYHYDMKHS